MFGEFAPWHDARVVVPSACRCGVADLLHACVVKPAAGKLELTLKHVNSKSCHISTARMPCWPRLQRGTRQQFARRCSCLCSTVTNTTVHLTHKTYQLQRFFSPAARTHCPASGLRPELPPVCPGASPLLPQGRFPRIALQPPAEMPPEEKGKAERG